MKGIYLTQQGKQEIEAKIAELEYKKSLKSDDNNIWYFQGKIDDLKEILSSATILPVEEDWYHVHFVLDEAGEQLNKEE
jgi:hypothetical protein